MGLESWFVAQKRAEKQVMEGKSIEGQAQGGQGKRKRRRRRRRSTTDSDSEDSSTTSTSKDEDDEHGDDSEGEGTTANGERGDAPPSAQTQDGPLVRIGVVSGSFDGVQARLCWAL